MLDTLQATTPRTVTGRRPERGLVGRDAEYATLVGAMDLAVAGTGQLVEVTGDPGIGKSRLLTELTAVARRRGMATVTVVATGGLAALARAFADHIETAAAPAGTGMRREHRAHLATLLRVPAHQGTGPAEFGGPDELTVRRQVTAVRALLTALATPQGLVVVLDDLHRADPTLVTMLRHLVGRPPRAALLLAFAYRGRQAPLALSSALREASGLIRLPLGPLAPVASAEFVPTSGPPRWRRALLAAGTGNPLYLRALTASARPGPAGMDGVELDPLPAAVLAPLLAELDALSPPARLAAQAAAVLGGCFEPNPVAFVADLAYRSRYPVFDELSRYDIVRPTAGTGEFVFRHQVLRHAVYQSTEPGWRLGAHARAAQVLRRRHAPAELLAPHLVRVAVPGDLHAAEILADAAAAVRDRCPEAAVGWLQAACRLVPDRPDTHDPRAELRFALGLALDAAGHPDAARDTLQEALLAGSRMTPGRLAAVAVCARLERQLGHRAQGRAMLRRELDGPAAPQQGYRAALLIELAGHDLLDGALAEARAGAGAARALAAPQSDARPMAAAASGLQALAYCLGADVTAATTHLTVAAGLLDGLLDQEVAARLEASVWVGWSELVMERPWDALRHVTRALRAGHGSGRHAQLTWLLGAQVVALRGLGRLAEAGATATEAVELATASGDTALRVFAETLRSWVAVWTGEVVEQRPAPRSTADLSAIGWFGIVCRVMHAEVRASGDDPDDRGNLTGPADLPTADPWSRITLLEHQARAALEAGRVDLADSWGLAAQTAADRLGLPGRSALARLARAHALTVQDPLAAVTAASTAATELAAAGLAVDARRATVVAAQALAATGQTESALRELSSAQQYFEQCGALRLARETGRLRVRLATRTRHGGRRQEVSGPQSLTAREEQVAGLVGDGLTNREIARRLDVKEKTVEMHLTRVFAKLGVTNRVGVVRMVLYRASQD
ncbi:helix-turn-helix transcriptional regulator [Micromonospora yangpuensis]|uniref:Regulatory protein, luxR family n=1 Tax=Micromonospora yangpuensis TaxID=683228 RepID=A0A1C6UEW8_9ACTN|nr:LuxR family transcriptional regulator [Micromonospora yangpuensis]GGM05929.1 hypothetical protein GCM10012279_24610 [Micromonospora yangpuensis]SCL52630.1 regulatory protein, luxR family [Micromonospora yangpuensis]